METRRPIGYEENVARHQQNLKDPAYLERFLKATEIPNEVETVANNLEQMYSLHGRRADLPDRSALVDIINRAHTDAQRSTRERIDGGVGWAGFHPVNPTVADNGYYVLRDLSARYVYDKEHGDYPGADHETALQHASEERKWTLATPILTIPYLTSWKEVGSVCTALPRIALYALTPNSIRARKFRDAVPYEQSPDGKEQFVQMRESIDPVIAHYAGGAV